MVKPHLQPFQFSTHEPAGSGPPPSPPVPRAGKVGVLIVDDDAGVRQMLETGLTINGFTAWGAAGGQEAVEAYRRHSGEIDVVLLDVRMPDLDGPAVLARLQQVNPEVRCCFLSGEIGNYSPSQLLKCGALALVTKPFSLVELVKLLRRLAGESRGR